MANQPRWVILPGLAIPPEDYRDLAYALDALVLNAWSLSVTRSAEQLRAALYRQLEIDPKIPNPPRIRLMGHSLGGLAALEWALRFPGEIDQLVLLDPTPPIGRPRLLQRALSICEIAARPAIGLGSLIAPLAPALRTAAVRHTTGREDLLPPDLAQRYFRRPRQLQLIMSQWLASYRQQARVAVHLRRLGPALPIFHLIGADHRDSIFARFQVRLAQQIGSELTVLRGQDHLFPLTRPDLILAHVP